MTSAAPLADERAAARTASLLSTLFNDIRTGVLMDRYPFRLQEIRRPRPPAAAAPARR
ncbi:MAG: hypothetical protein MZW92_46120 [Comamonadaceae bacterium]|nr:hypothetical protein [Comamonadaceae bacterium]